MRRLAFLLLLSILLTAPAFAADPVIHRGIDVWTTSGNGSSYYDFKKNPIPAGFFCPGSAPFAEKVALGGVPIAVTGLGKGAKVDTIVERLDDAAFDGQGVASTRIVMRGLSLQSVKPIETSCGAFHVQVSLADTQRTTVMRIQRTNERGGTFAAPLAVNAKLTFVPVEGSAQRPLVMVGDFTFPAPQNAGWAYAPANPEPVTADLNLDGRPETRLPGVSNFVAGVGISEVETIIQPTCEEICHCYYQVVPLGRCDHLHCVYAAQDGSYTYDCEVLPQ
jgi:hypothetical protein